MYYIELLLTKECNQKCYYCNTHNKDGKKEIDLDFLKYVLNCLPSETGVEIKGGEIGLIENIDEVYKLIKDSYNIKHIIVLSNGLIRKIGIDWLKDIEYWEHLIYDIEGKEIIKFYDDLSLNEDHKYVIVTTKTTTKSLLDNWKYFEDIGLLRENFFYKLMNNNGKKGIESYYNNLVKLYGKISNKYFSSMLTHYKIPKYLKSQKLKCMALSPNPFVDFETRELGHCSIHVTNSKRISFSKVTFDLFRNGFFKIDEPYCELCYSFDCGRNRTIHNNRSYEKCSW